MATAVEPGSQPRAPSKPISLPIASLLGAVYVVAALAVVFYVIPTFWKDSVDPKLRNDLASGVLRVAVQVGGIVGLVAFGRKLLGDAPPKGVRGGVFLIITFATLIFFVWRALALSLDSTPGMAISFGVAAIAIYFSVRFFTGKRGEGWMVSLEEQGWFHAKTYKRTLGQKVRRLTILGILLIGATGVYSLYFQGVLPLNWVLTMPFEWNSITVLTEARYAIPLLLLALTLWVAFRAVNIPSFAEFLIATEAEMNKVSWTPKKRLAQDTVVVLTTTLLMALFLLVVDLFWGWLLSRQNVGVLPPKATAPDKANKTQQPKW